MIVGMNRGTAGAGAESALPTVASPEQVDLLEPAQLKCPWVSYDVLREQAPVWQDPRTGHYVVSRFDDVRRVLLDPETFRASFADADDTHRPEIRALYEEKGMLPGTTMNGLDDPLHRQVRGLMDHAFRPRRVEALDPFIEELCRRLLAGFIDDGKVELAEHYAHEMTLRVMTHLMGVPEEDGHQIRAWADAWIARLSQTMTPEEEIWSCEQEIEAQHYFQKIIDRVRKTPEDNLISDIVNGIVPDWGHGLPDNQIQIEILVDMFTGGTQTTGHALTSAVKIGIEDPELWETVRRDPGKHLPTFIEEVIRVDGPQQGNPRIATADVEIAGVTIPKGAIVNVRWGAGNRDPRRYGERAGEIDLDRHQPRTHVGFGAGTHYCIGAAVARREMWHGLKTLMDNMERMWFLEDDLDYVENYTIRGLKRLPIGFEKRQK
jgi:cytochrome P450